MKERTGKDERLRCRIVDGKVLTISIGIDTLAHAFMTGPVGDEITRDDEHQYGYDSEKLRVTDAVAFANDVVRALLDEREDGSSPLTDTLDKAFRDALDDGAQGVFIRGVLED